MRKKFLQQFSYFTCNIVHGNCCNFSIWYAKSLKFHRFAWEILKFQLTVLCYILKFKFSVQQILKFQYSAFQILKFYAKSWIFNFWHTDLEYSVQFSIKRVISTLIFCSWNLQILWFYMPYPEVSIFGMIYSSFDINYISSLFWMQNLVTLI